MNEAFNEYCPIKENRIWLTLHLVLKEAMKIVNSNKYQIPHINKKILGRQSRIPLQIDCEASRIIEAMAILIATNNYENDITTRQLRFA
jgi:hypothetical protein